MAENLKTIEISDRVANELLKISDPQVVTSLKRFQVHPRPTMRSWDYGEEGEAFTCWHVFEDKRSDTAIVYCSQGFGPKRGWGLVSLSGSYMGMDSAWFASLEEAFRESQFSD